MVLGLAGAVDPRHPRVREREEVVALGVEEVGQPRAEPLLRQLQGGLELMPVADFPGRWNWGYDGVALWAPSRFP